MNEYYFQEFEARRPLDPCSIGRKPLWLHLAVTGVLAAANLTWLGVLSLNQGAMWFALPLVIVDALAFLGLVLFAANLWKRVKSPVLPDREFINDSLADSAIPVPTMTVDVVLTTYDAKPEVARLGIQDAKKIGYPFPVNLRIHVFDEGKSDAIRRIASEESINYTTRTNSNDLDAARAETTRTPGATK